MGFLSSLGKGFVKSAVNQVGRDTGRQVSNAMFNSATSKTGETVSISELQPVTEYVFLKIVGALILSFIIPFIGGLFVITQAFINFRKDYKKYIRIETQDIYVQDKRFTTGKRLEGQKNVKVIYKAPIDDAKASSNKIKGTFYILIGLGSIAYYSYALYVYLNK